MLEIYAFLSAHVCNCGLLLLLVPLSVNEGRGRAFFLGTKCHEFIACVIPVPNV